MLIGGLIQSQTQIDSSRILTDERVQAIEKLILDAQTYQKAYNQEHSTRLADSSNYVYSFRQMVLSNDNLTNAVKVALADNENLRSQISKAEWMKWVYAIGGGVAVGVIVWIVQAVRK